jgi:tetratricopeptide (TPR) repeat protein
MRREAPGVEKGGRMARGTGLRGGVAAAVLALAPAALAQPADPAAFAEARFQEGVKLLAAGNAAEACPKLEESQRLAPSYGALFNLADCEERLGKTASAWAAFREAAAFAKASGQAEREAKAEHRAAELDAKLVRVAVVVPAAVPGLAVRRNGAVVDVAGWGVAVAVDPGPVTVEASVPGKRCRRSPTRRRP